MWRRSWLLANERRVIVGNPGGSPEAARRLVNKALLQDMAIAWRKYGMKALEQCAKKQPASFVKMYVLLVPREMKVEHSAGVKDLTDEQLEQAIVAVNSFEMCRTVPVPTRGAGDERQSTLISPEVAEPVG